MRATVATLLVLLANAAFAAPGIDAPPTALAGTRLAINVTGSGNPRDFVTLVRKDAAEGQYGSYEYIAKTGKFELVMPGDAGDYELRVLAADSPYRTLFSRPLKLTMPIGTVQAPAQVNAGASFEVRWTGPDNDRDFISIADAANPAGGSYLTYEYTRSGNPVKFRAPEKPGIYETRYILGSGNTAIARQRFTVGAVSATVSGPAQVSAGAKFKVSWTGPNNTQDFITLVKSGAAERAYERYEYTGKGTTLELTAPEVAGEYELRYLTGRDYLTLARAKVTVGAITGSLTAPPQAVAGEPVKIGWKGPNNPQNFITIVAMGAREGAYGTYAYTRAENPLTVLAPLVPGDYEVRYSTAQTYATLARTSIKVTPAKLEPGKVAVTLAAGTKTNGTVEIILDASGSMLQKLGSQRRIDIARQTLTKLTSSTIPAGTPFAFRVFGREVDSCQTDLDVPVGPLNPAAVGQRIAALVAKNGAKTPIGASLEKVADDLKGVSGEKLVVLITDGEETCGGDPAAAIASLRKAGLTIRISIVGFALEDPQLAATFRRWSDAGGGAFFDAKDAAGLDQSLTQALRPGFEVLNAQGQVLASGIVGGDAVPVGAGNHTVRIKGGTASAKPVTVKPKETANVSL